MKPLKVITVPDAVNSATCPVASPETSIFAVVVETLASCIWDATVRFQIKS